MTTHLLLAAALSLAADPPTIELWPDGVPGPKVEAAGPERTDTADGIDRRYDVTKPRLLVYEAPAEGRTGAGVVVVPGGGFTKLADGHEGAEACQWLNTLGLTAFLLVHRCPTDKHPDPGAGPVIDTQRAVSVVRQQAEKWKVDPKKLGVLAFSAGGQVALRAATNDLQYSAGAAAAASHKPDFLLVLYGWRVFDPKTKALRADIRPDAGLPPTFIAQCADDKGSVPQGSALLFLELINRKVPAELHIYETGGHGFGMRPRPGAAGPGDWPLRAADWLRARGLARKV